MRFFRNEYSLAIKRTSAPRSGKWADIITSDKINRIIDSYTKAYKESHNGRDMPWYYGVWINGWNEELQKPNFIISTSIMPLDVIAKQKHCLDGIPDEYYKTLAN